MKEYVLEKAPVGYSWNDGECDKIFENAERYYGTCQPDAVFYWYVCGCYEGDGELIAIKDGRWYHKELSHCSCYGPLDDFAYSIEYYRFSSLEELYNSGTENVKDRIKELVNLAKIEGYK